jgi:inner membrane protein
MTIYTHAVVGMGLAAILFPRPRPRPWLFWTLVVFLPIIPDFDALSWANYGTSWGHRGFTHSLSFALALGLIVAGVACRYLQVSFWILGGVFFVLTASHGFLDAFTRGGAGIPFFWPFLEQRFGGWGPVPVSDVGFELPNPLVSKAVRGELLWVWVPIMVLVGLAIVSRRIWVSGGDSSRTV